MINQANCPTCGNNDAAVIDDDGPPVVLCNLCGYEGDPGDFDHDDYEWISSKDQCPEEGGLVLVDLFDTPADGTPDYGLAVYVATEKGDRWIRVNADGSAGSDLEELPIAWAELPKGCYDFPRPGEPFKGSTVYKWGGVWAWIICDEKTGTGKEEVCWPFETKKEATAALKAKLKEIEE
jgi:Zn ribbon nucleic-acid-binding protein